jgi:hypothetical protein
VTFLDDAVLAQTWLQSSLPDASAAASSEATLASLFVGFLDFYAHRWDWTGGAVDIRGSVSESRGVHCSKRPPAWRLSVRDPFELAHDLGRVLTEERQIAMWTALHVCSVRAASARAGRYRGSSGSQPCLFNALWSPVDEVRRTGLSKMGTSFCAVVCDSADASMTGTGSAHRGVPSSFESSRRSSEQIAYACIIPDPGLVH